MMALWLRLTQLWTHDCGRTLATVSLPVEPGRWRQSSRKVHPCTPTQNWWTTLSRRLRNSQVLFCVVCSSWANGTWFLLFRKKKERLLFRPSVPLSHLLGLNETYKLWPRRSVFPPHWIERNFSDWESQNQWVPTPWDLLFREASPWSKDWAACPAWDTPAEAVCNGSLCGEEWPRS